MTDRAKQPALKLVGGRSARRPGQPAPVVRSEHLGDHCLHCGAALPRNCRLYLCCEACSAGNDGPEAA